MMIVINQGKVIANAHICEPNTGGCFSYVIYCILNNLQNVTAISSKPLVTTEFIISK